MNSNSVKTKQQQQLVLGHVRARGEGASRNGEGKRQGVVRVGREMFGKGKGDCVSLI